MQIRKTKRRGGEKFVVFDERKFGQETERTKKRLREIAAENLRRRLQPPWGEYFAITPAILQLRRSDSRSVEIRLVLIRNSIETNQVKFTWPAGKIRPTRNW